MLLPPPPSFPGLAPDSFRVFAIADREARRRAIIAAFHPPLKALADDVLGALDDGGSAPFHAHLPQLNWPKGYVPFCTWLALSRRPHGYQAGPQLGVAVHADHVAARLGWDAGADAFGRFEFRCRHGGLGEDLVEAARTLGLRFRVHAAAPWPEGSRVTFESEDDLAGSFRDVARRGVFWELGRRWEIPESSGRLADPGWSVEVRELLAALLPLHDRAD